MNATTDRGNKFQPCPHDPEGLRRDECVQCHPPERYLGLSGNLIVTAPRIETVPDEWAARDWLANHELPNRLVHYFNANGDEDFDHADLLSTILTEFAGRARAGAKK